MVYRKAQQWQGFFEVGFFLVIIHLQKSSLFLLLEVGQFIVCGLKALLPV